MYLDALILYADISPSQKNVTAQASKFHVPTPF